MGRIFGAWLRGQLESGGWRVDDFARAIGVSSQAVYLWLEGRQGPSPARIVRIADSIRVSPANVLAELERDRRPGKLVPTSTEDRPLPGGLRLALAGRGWTATDLARQLDLSPATVRSWLRGTREPPGPLLQRVADLLGIDLDTLR